MSQWEDYQFDILCLLLLSPAFSHLECFIKRAKLSARTNQTSIFSKENEKERRKRICHSTASVAAAVKVFIKILPRSVEILIKPELDLTDGKRNGYLCIFIFYLNKIAEENKEYQY